jgi:hypothetical protein
VGVDRLLHFCHPTFHLEAFTFPSFLSSQVVDMSSPAMSSPAPAYESTPHSAFTEDWNTSMANNELEEAHEQMKQKKDASNLSQHPDILSPGLEPMYYGQEGKEVVPQPLQIPQQPPRGTGNFPYHDDAKYAVNPEGEQKHRSRICGVPKALLLWLLVILLIIAIGLGVGLGVGLGTKKRCVIIGPRSNSIY